jgi:MFS family permease
VTTPTTTSASTAGAHASSAAVVGVLSFAVFMTSLDLFIVNLAFPYISREYAGTSLGSLSWVLNGYTIVFAATLVPAGRWADRVGRRRMFLVGLVTFTAGSLACGFSPDVAVLIAARVVQAIGGGAMVPASLSILLATVPPPAGRRQSAPGPLSGRSVRL